MLESNSEVVMGTIRGEVNDRTKRGRVRIVYIKSGRGIKMGDWSSWDYGKGTTIGKAQSKSEGEGDSKHRR